MLLLLLACRHHPTPADVDADTDADADTGAPLACDDIDPEPHFVARPATISVTEAVVSVDLLDGPLPWVLVEADRQGACRLLTMPVPSCPSGCTPPEECVGQDVCASFPSRLLAGTLTFDGVPGVTTVSPRAGSLFYDGAVPTALPGPADVVSASAEGDDLPPFAVATCGVTPLTLDVIPTWEEGVDLVLTWPTTDPGSRIRARFASDYAHRLTPEVVECDAPDTGRLVVPATMLDTVMNGTWSCGSCILYHRITRYRSGRVDAGGLPVDLEVSSTVPLPIGRY